MLNLNLQLIFVTGITPANKCKNRPVWKEMKLTAGPSFKQSKMSQN